MPKLEIDQKQNNEITNNKKYKSFLLIFNFCNKNFLLSMFKNLAIFFEFIREDNEKITKVKFTKKLSKITKNINVFPNDNFIEEYFSMKEINANGSIPKYIKKID